MASRLDSANSEKKPAFKKRSHRPWKPALLETVIQNPNQTVDYDDDEDDVTSSLSASVSSSVQAAQFDSKFDQKFDSRFDSRLDSSQFDSRFDSHFDSKMDLLNPDLEVDLQQKIRQKEDLYDKLSSNEGSRITLGGFFKPKNIIFPDDNAALHNTTHLMGELKRKEYEILEISHNLKVNQAVEQAERAQRSLHAEIQAREAADERALFALNKAQQSADNCLLAEQQLTLAQRNISALEHTVVKLEERLKNALIERHQTIELLAQEVELKKVAEENVKMLGIELSQKALVEERNAELFHSLNMAENAKVEARREIQILSSELSDCQQQLAREKTNIARLEGEIVSQQEMMAQLTASKNLTEEQLTKSTQHIKKMNMVLATERNLRNLYEEKAREMSCRNFTLEMEVKAQEQGRRVAEEKAKQTLDQASRVMMRMINNAQQ